jgi:uncharacterized membrane protein YphA (DoxX/SURF4 family)
MKASKKSIAGRVLSLLLALFLIVPSAGGKFIEWDGKQEMFSHLGYSTELMTRIGVVEVIVALLIVIPRTAFVGAILLTAYLGGAVATHVRVGDPYYMPILMGVLLWIAMGLRRPEVFALASGAPPPRTVSLENVPA